MSKTLYLKVVGEHRMHCDSCAQSVTFALSQLPWVEEAKADWKDQVIEVDLSSDEVDFEKLKTELDWIGYEVEMA